MKKLTTIVLVVCLSVTLFSFSSNGNSKSAHFSLDPKEIAVFEIQDKEVVPFPTYQFTPSENTQKAIDSSPDWLQKELFKSFQDLDKRPIALDTASNPCFGDINGDGSQDLLLFGQEKDYTIYLNQNFHYQFCLQKTEYQPIDFPVSTVPENEDVKTNLHITPSLFDLNKDAKDDLFLGINNQIYFAENISNKDDIIFDKPVLIFEEKTEEPVDPADEEEDPEPEEPILPEAYAPCAFLLNDIPSIAVGKADGSLFLLQYIEEDENNSWKEIDNYFVSWNEHWEEEPTKEGVGVNSYATPCVLSSEYSLNDTLLTMCIGSASGNFSFFIIHSKSMLPQIQTTELLPEFPSPKNTRPAFTDINSDGRIDFVFGSDNGKISYFLNYGKDFQLLWNPLNSNAENNNLQNFFGGIGYHRAYDFLYSVGNNSELIETVSTFINETEDEYKDEVIYCIANFQVADIEQYFNEGIQDVLVENVKSIYYMAEEVNYCSILEEENYTTLSYKSRKVWDDKESEIVDLKLPKEIYYQYLVMMNRYLLVPTRWEEYYKKNFYRSFLPFDTTYVHGEGEEASKEKPANVTLFERVKDAETMYDAAWNIMFWLKDDIGGIWHTGEKPRGWFNIYNNLLNLDVGIWCGEWSIIYEACARSMNIPTVIIIGLGEDHQYNNFYDNGWHHVDPSAGESGDTGTWEPYIGNSLIYYEKWGKRIFSWPMEREGNGKYDHVWRSKLPYNPPEKLTNISFKVYDENHLPVEGARIELWSHWPMENNYVPVPFPSAFGYTDSFGKGFIEKVGHQNFTCVVTSRIGTTNFLISLRDASSIPTLGYEVIIPGTMQNLYHYNMAPDPNFSIDHLEPITVEATEETEAWYDDEKGFEYIPVAILEKAKCTVTVDEKSATISNDKHSLTLTVDSKEATLDKETIALHHEEVPILHNGAIYIPIHLTTLLEIETRFNDMRKLYEFYIVDVKEVSMEFSSLTSVQKNHHWIDGYTTILDYIDYWTPTSSTFDCIVLSEYDLFSLLHGNTIHQCDWITIASEFPTSSFSSTLPKEGKYYVLLVNNNYASSIQGDVSFAVRP